VKLGIVSDTHGYVDPRLLLALAGVDLILHAGDVGGKDVLAALRDIAPVQGVYGNNDVKLGGLGLPLIVDIEVAGKRIRVVHEVKDRGALDGVDVLVFGHSHQSVCDTRDGVLWLNPGAAGRQGFHPLQTLALLTIDDAGGLSVEQVTLGPRLTLPRRAKASRVP
jgi:uncharacterized protein